MSIWRSIQLAATGIFLAALAGLPLPAAAAPAVAYVDHVYPAGGRLNQALRVERGGRVLPISGASIDLEPGDRLFIQKRREGEWVVTVRYLANNSVVTVRRGVRTGRGDEADLTVQRPSLPGVTGDLLAWLKAQFSGEEQRRRTATMAASRGPDGSGSCSNAGGRTNDPIVFAMPALTAARSQVVAGPRALFVAWRGGAAPFQVTLSKAGGDTAIVQQDDIRDGCTAWLPRADLEPGRYRLQVIDANHVRLEEDSLFAAADAPPMPPQLRDAGLPEEARQLYFATWLAGVDDGRWAFEALQRVAAMDCRSAAVQEWLRPWGDPVKCGP